MARQGYPRMAISACFGGIIFSILSLHGNIYVNIDEKHFIYTYKFFFKKRIVPLTALPLDMLFGVGLGCLVQMIQTQSGVQVIISLWVNLAICDRFGLCKADASFSFSYSVRIRRIADMGSCRISWFVSGPVFYRCSTVQVPLGSDLRNLPPHLLCHLPSHCTSHWVWHNPYLTGLKNLTSQQRTEHRLEWRLQKIISSSAQLTHYLNMNH